MRAKQASRLPWVFTALALIAGLAVAAYFALFRVPEGPPVGPGVLVLESTPPGAAIRIDGSPHADRTPTRIERLPVGRYTVTISAEGYVPVTEAIDLTEAAPEGRLSATLERPTASAYGVAQLSTTPPGAHVLLDGQDRGVTPITVGEIEPGVHHTFVISLDGYVTQTRELLMTAGQVETLAFAMERTPLGPDEALVRLVVDPPDARVQLDATWYETGSPYELRIPARHYRLRVVHPSRRMDERELELPGGQTTELTITLERERERPVQRGGTEPVGGGAAAAAGPGQITIDARPWCNVTIDGRSLGQTPIVNHSIASGRHTVVCTNPELDASRTVSVEVRPGETTRTRISLE